ncbi:MAG: hypothetical protein H8E89_08425 [Candidatus Nitrosopelagicus sp.]|nr:hypothetical protein [Candidatus Nitrosopelagicus sp.]
MYDKKYWLLGIFFILLALNVLNMTLNNPYEIDEPQYTYFNQPFMPFTAIIPTILALSCFFIIKKNKKLREKQIENILNDSIEREDDVLHDENQEPVTYVNEKEVESIEHEEHVEHDDNDEPVTFIEKSEDEN